MSDDIISFNTEELSKVKVNETPTVPIFSLVPEDDSVLFEVLPEFDFNNPPVNPIEFASSLVETCKSNRGLGLSANQCGFKYRVFVAGSDDNYVAYFNPKIIATSSEEKIGVEGCLSYPNLFLNVVRPQVVKVEYQDFNGEIRHATFEGLTARVFLHELDHMDGITFKQRAKPLALKSGIDKRNKFIHRLEKAAKKLDKLKKAKR